MVLIPVLCPHCHSEQVIRGGKTKAGQQRYKCQNAACPHYSFQLDLLFTTVHFFLLNGDMELHRNRHLFIEKMF